MLAEALLYVLTPTEAWARKHGFLRESIAIGARHRRLKGDWADHLQNTRAFVLQAAARCDRTRHAVILGSGHGFDLPLRDLAHAFDRLTLIDAVHPLSIQLKALKNDGIYLSVADVNGTVGPRPMIADDTDLVVSLNVISQLGVASGDDVSTQESFRSDHLRWLMELGVNVCLIGDVERIENRAGTSEGVVSKIDWPGLDSCPVPSKTDDWFWRIAPYGEIARDVEVVRKVRALTWIRR